MYTVPPDVRRVAFRLGLGDLNAKTGCHGYGNCCTCTECSAQAKLINEHRAARRYPFTSDGKVKRPPTKPQPWHTRETA